METFAGSVTVYFIIAGRTKTISDRYSCVRGGGEGSLLVNCFSLDL